MSFEKKVEYSQIEPKNKCTSCKPESTYSSNYSNYSADQQKRCSNC